MICTLGLILCLACNLPKWCFVLNLVIGIIELILMKGGNKK